MYPTGGALRQREASRSWDFKKAFDILDADGDGKINREDLRMFFAGLYGGAEGENRAGDDVISAMISVADFNKDGYVQYDEFECVLSYGKRESGGGREMEDVFGVMDKDGDGRLSLDDLKSYMNWAGFRASDDDIKDMIKLGGGDLKEGVSFDGLLKILAVDDARLGSCSNL